MVGLSLGMIGSGGSILAVPLMAYLVGLSPHLAIGTSAVAVAASALVSLAGHARARTVKWPCALVFAMTGMLGAAIGAQIGKRVDGRALLAAFGVLMIVVAALLLRPRRTEHEPEVRLTSASARRLLPPLIAMGFATGALAGFFGIGGGFLVVPALIAVTSMPVLNAIGSSLLSIFAFGATTAVSYALSGLVAWPVAGLFVLGGLAGAYAGIEAAKALAGYKRLLMILFSAVVALMGVYVTARGLARFI